jgi:exosortase/archaeosortase family protein
MNKVYYLLLRYLVLVAVAIPNFVLFYIIFTPLTIYPVFFALNLFFNVSLESPFILFDNFRVHIIPACVAGSAYYLLMIFNFSTPMKFKTRIKSLLFSFLFLLILNILRILLLIIIFIYGSNYFQTSHLLFWYFLSTLFVIGIWFVEVKVFNIREIPIYSDLKYLINLKRK